MGTKSIVKPAKKPKKRQGLDPAESLPAEQKKSDGEIAEGADARKVQEELADTRARLVSTEQERDLALKRLQIEEGRSAEVQKRNETLLDLYMQTSKLADRRQDEIDELRRLWEQSSELAERQGSDLIELQAAVNDLTAKAERSCSHCGADGLVYVFEGKPYCAACLAKKRPPLPYRGSERRKSQRPVIWRRRDTDSPGKKP